MNKNLLNVYVLKKYKFIYLTKYFKKFNLRIIINLNLIIVCLYINIKKLNLYSSNKF